MNIMHAKTKSTVLLLKPTYLTLAMSMALMLSSTSASAQQPAWYDLDSNWYGGVSISHTQKNIDDSLVANHNLIGDLTSITDSSHDTGYKIFMGYQLNNIFALEGGYFDTGKFGFHATQQNVGELYATTKTYGLNVDLVGLLPLTQRFSVFARVGAHYSEEEDHYTGTRAVVVNNAYVRNRDTNIKFGAGLQYDVTPKLALRVEAERYNINDVIGNNGNINMYSVGVVYRFGDKSSPRYQPQAQASAPKPIPLVPVAAQEMQQYCSKLNIQFDINNDQIQREDLERLSVLGTFLQKYPQTSAVIEGHTDNMGTEQYNQTLSRQRADSVVNYLVKEQGIARDRLTAVGYSDTRPIADNTTESGKRANRRINAIIDCATDIEGLNPVAARVTMGMLMEFDLNSAVVKPQYYAELAKIGNYLQQHDKVTASIEGHSADSQTTPSVAQQLSLKRAQNVVDYLVKNEGIERSRLSVEGFGKSRRYSYGNTVESQQDNNRVNIIFTYPQ